MAILLSLVGCTPSPYPYRAQTPPPSAYYRPTPPPTQAQPAIKPIEIISDPPGARIEVNDDYVGDAPIVVTVSRDDGHFKNQTVIRAMPI